MVYLAFHNVAYKNIFKRFKQYKRQRYGFYECGFRPKHEASIEINLYVYVMIALVIVYDVEGVFLLFFAINFDTLCFCDCAVVLLYALALLAGLIMELLSSSTRWAFY